jgi:uncharacterized protein YndB with AHSA1/START domain
MSHNLAFDFSVDKPSKTITIKREFAAELPMVWDAYTKSDILDMWWAPKPWKAKTKTMDFREGGHWFYVMEGPGGEAHWAMVEYKNIIFQKKFTGIDAFADPAGIVNKDMPQSMWEVTFVGKGEITLVESLISYEDLAQLEATLQMGFKEGITMALGNLDEYIAAHHKIRNKKNL